MSHRTLIELNHDYCPQNTEELIKWANAMQAFMRSGDDKLLPKGAAFKGSRHHSDPEFVVADSANCICIHGYASTCPLHGVKGLNSR